MVKSTSRRIKSTSKRAAGKAAPRKPAAPAKAPPKKPSAKAPAKSKWVFGFGNGKAEGRADMRNLRSDRGACARRGLCAESDRLFRREVTAGLQTLRDRNDCKAHVRC
jgi:hypothetical protein